MKESSSVKEHFKLICPQQRFLSPSLKTPSPSLPLTLLLGAAGGDLEALGSGPKKLDRLSYGKDLPW